MAEPMSNTTASAALKSGLDTLNQAAASTMLDPALYTPKLNRIRGQVDGIVSMCEQQRSAVEIAQQIIAARNALSSVARELLSHEALRCANHQCYDDLEAVVKELLR